MTTIATAPCPFMLNSLLKFLLLNIETGNIETWYKALVTWGQPSLFKWFCQLTFLLRSTLHPYTSYLGKIYIQNVSRSCNRRNLYKNGIWVIKAFVRIKILFQVVIFPYPGVRFRYKIILLSLQSVLTLYIVSLSNTS